MSATRRTARPTIDRRRRSLTAGSFLSVAVIVGLSACGDDRPDSVDTDDAPASVEAEDAPLITIVDFDFGDPITVTEDSTVRVENADGVGHTWTSDDGLFESGFLEPGDSFEFVFEQAGEFSFFCEIHPSMSGSVTVTS